VHASRLGMVGDAVPGKHGLLAERIRAAKSLAASRAQFCGEIDEGSAKSSATLAAIGILSHEPRTNMRDAIRATWLPEMPTTMAARFVLRGLELQRPDAIEAEAMRHRDLVLVRAVRCSLPNPS